MVLMSISLDEVQHVAHLARLDLDEAELLAFQGELNALLGHFEDIADLDVSNTLPKPHAVALLNVFADDMAEDGLPRERAMGNAATTRAGLFLVPKIIED
mgnify:FL=1